MIPTIKIIPAAAKSAAKVAPVINGMTIILFLFVLTNYLLLYGNLR